MYEYQPVFRVRSVIVETVLSINILSSNILVARKFFTFILNPFPNNSARTLTTLLKSILYKYPSMAYKNLNKK